MEAGDQDPKETIASQIADMIGLSEDQVAFVKDKMTQRTTLEQQLECAIELLHAIEKSKKLDIESVRIVRKLLASILDSYKEAIRKFTEDTKEIKDAETGNTGQPG